MDKSFLKSIEKPALETTRRDYKPMLVIGVFVMLLSIVLRTILTLTGQFSETQDVLHDQLLSMYEKSALWMILYVCVLTPLMEEFSFRSWTTGKRWVYWVSWACMTAIMLVSQQWICAGVFSMAVLAIGLLVKGQKRLIWHLAVATSLAFGMSHNGGFSTLDAVAVFTMSQMFGLAMINCYLGLRWHWLVGVAVHAGVNILGVIAMLFSSQIVYGDSRHLIAAGNIDNLEYTLSVGITYYHETDESVYFVGRGTFPEIYVQLLKEGSQSGTRDSLRETIDYVAKIPDDESYTFKIIAEEGEIDFDRVQEAYLDIVRLQGCSLYLDTTRYDDKLCVTVRQEID